MRIRTEQADISVRDSGGDGFPLLMLHGSAASKDVFAHQFEPPLTERFRVIAMDLPGHGESSDARDPGKAYTTVGLAACARDVLAELSVRRAAVYGWSLGGHVAIELAGDSDLVAGLMLTGTPPVGRGPLAMLRGFHARWDMLLASKEHFSDRDAERFAELCFDGAVTQNFIDAVKRSDGRARAVFQRSMMRGDGVDQKLTVENSTGPVAIVNGAAEPFVRLGYFPTLHYRNLWRDNCFVIAGAGHAPFWQQPDRFNPLLLQFCEDVVLSEVARTQRRARSA